MKNCTRPSWRSRLTAYADGELDRSAASEVAAHIAVCPRCHAAVGLDLRIGRAIRALPAWNAPASVTSGVLERIAVTPASGYRRIARWIPALRIAVPSALVLALVAGLKIAGVYEAMLSFLSITVLGGMRALAAYVANVTETLSPVAKVVDLGHMDRILLEAARAIMATPMLGLAVAIFVATLFLILLGARFLAPRSPRGVGHAALLV